MERDPWFWQRVALEVKVGNPTRKLILCAISRRIEVESGRGFVPQEHLAREAECDERTVRRHLKILEDEGFIRRYRRTDQEGRRAPDDFEILLAPWEAQRADNLSDNLSGGSAPTGQSGPSLPDTQVSGELPGELPMSSPDGEDTAREPVAFTDWLQHHARVSGHSVPGVGTQRRGHLLRAFRAIEADGFNPDDFTAASRAVTTEWHKERGHDSFETVLRKTEFGAKVARGRAEQAKDAARAPMREKYEHLDDAPAPVDGSVFD